MDQALYQALAARARGRCECGACGLPVPPGEVDHFFSRARAEEVEATCWVLSPSCHRSKTDNRPSAAHWFRLFIQHCRRWGYSESALRAQKDMEWRMAKGTTA